MAGIVLQKTKEHLENWWFVYIIIIIILLIIFHPIYPKKPSWYTFSKLLRDNGVTLRDTDGDTSTLSVPKRYTADTCEAYAYSSWHSDDSWGDRPYGCVRYIPDGRIFFNQNTGTTAGTNYTANVWDLIDTGKLYKVFSDKNNIIGDGSTKNYQDKTYNFTKATDLMTEKGLAWQGEDMRNASNPYIYIPECAYTSSSFPWKECLTALDIPIPLGNLPASLSGTFPKKECFPKKKVTKNQPFNVF